MSPNTNSTPRQQIVETVSYRAAQRNYEAWRFEIGDPTTESATYEYCQNTEGVTYNPRPTDLDTLREMIDGFAGDQHARPQVYKYYMNASDKTLDRLEAEIMREAADRLARMQDTYDHAQHMARIVPAQALIVAPDQPAANDRALAVASETERIAAAGQLANDYARAGAFHDYNSRKADNTLTTHRTALKRFAEFMAGAGIIAPDDIDGKAERLQHNADEWHGITHGLITGFREWMKTQGDAIGSLNVRLSSVKTYAKLAFVAGTIDATEHALIRTVTGYSRKEAKRVNEKRDNTRRGRKKAHSVELSDRQAEQLKMHPDTPQGRRDALLMCLLLDHGLRCGEVAALTVENFNLETGYMTFYRPKVDIVDQQKLTGDTLKAARAWFAAGDAPLMSNQPILRGSRKGGALTTAGMSEQAITKRVQVLGAEIGLESLSAHDCRHYWATYWANRVDRLPKGLLSLQEAGGWASLEMPRRYVARSQVSNEGMV